ncbi:MAG TPA: TIGR03364 family FAD-dependent oxidoreductase [Acetobacteraceae bacterium]|jgi:FAD dependent oxidoreductase TIGR03364|nr:TIGR03364 family FAD-dependent oxidoreductase [Acetobacteraceae bacterium]
MTTRHQFDCAIVGGGIVGLGHALAAVRHGLRTAVIDRDARAVGASVRNFGFITVTGQPAGATWRRAMRSRDIWAQAAAKAGIVVHHRGLLMCARRPEAMAVLEEFADGPMGKGCRVLGRDEVQRFRPALRDDLEGALYSPHELRVESREAVAQLAAWLGTQGVTFLNRVAAHAVAPGVIGTSIGEVRAERIVVCPGTDLVTLFPEIADRRRVTLCKLHMMRVAAPGWRLPAAVMSDLGLIRYLGYADCPSLAALRARLEREQTAWLADGIHLIAVQGADGSLVVGDSHRYSLAPDPFQPRDVDDRILAELSAVLDVPTPEVIERWVGIYPSGPDVAFTESPCEGVRLVLVTSGTGASTAFAIGEETLADLLGLAPPPHVREIAGARA